MVTNKSWSIKLFSKIMQQATNKLARNSGNITWNHLFNGHIPGKPSLAGCSVTFPKYENICGQTAIMSPNKQHQTTNWNSTRKNKPLDSSLGPTVFRGKFCQIPRRRLPN